MTKIDKMVKNAQEFFGLAVVTDNNRKTVRPTVTNTKTKKEQPVQYSSEVEKLFDYYLNQCTTNMEDVAARDRRNKLLKQMYVEAPIITMAVEMLADEAVSVQDTANFIGIKTKNAKLSKKINELLDSWEINQNTARSQFVNLALYGDAFKYRKITNKGIEGFNYLDVNDIKRRFEFNPLKINDYAESKGVIHTIGSNYVSIQDLIDSIEGTKDSNLNNMLDSVLFGFELTMGVALPPWGISHARLYSTDSEFFPYGRSLFINSISAFLQLKASKNLMIMARAENNPTEIYEVTTGENQTETEKWNALNRFVQNLKSLTSTQTQAEQKGIKSTIFTVKDSFTYRLESPNIDLGNIADIEMLEMDLIRPTGIPLDLLFAESGWASSGKALLEQSKPFSRKVYMLQTAYLENLMEDIKLHLALTDDVDKDEDFELFMQFPVLGDTDDIISSKNATLEMVTSIIQSIKDAIGLDVNVDIDKNIIIDLFSKYSFLDIVDIKKVVNSIYAGKEEVENAVGEEEFFNINNEITPPAPQPFNNTAQPQETNDEKEDDATESDKLDTKKVEEKILKRSLGRKLTEAEYDKLNKQLSESLMKEAYFKAKKDLRLNEGVSNKKHYMMSNYRSSSTQRLLNLVEVYKTKDLGKKKKLK